MWEYHPCPILVSNVENDETIRNEVELQRHVWKKNFHTSICYQFKLLKIASFCNYMLISCLISDFQLCKKYLSPPISYWCISHHKLISLRSHSHFHPPCATSLSLFLSLCLCYSLFMSLSLFLPIFLLPLSPYALSLYLSLWPATCLKWLNIFSTCNQFNRVTLELT